MGEKTQPHLGKERIGEHVVEFPFTIGKAQILLRGLGEKLFPQAVEFGSQQIRRPAFDGRGAREHALAKSRIDRSRSGTILPLEHRLGFLGQRLVALAGKHIEHRLSAHDLGGGRHQRNESQLLAHPRDFRQHLVHSLRRALFPQLVFHVGQHAAGHLGHQDAGIDTLQ